MPKYLRYRTSDDLNILLQKFNTSISGTKSEPILRQENMLIEKHPGINVNGFNLSPLFEDDTASTSTIQNSDMKYSLGSIV